ncbi:hypothetical protein HHI36_010424 [Cryptolaemus montrouzieri]|uniref:Uncharacterized protein n=1 Tax=Cryptolaemus montrouzieri TaxID=559131 RepID=A0ABD2MIP2_9CUCU
MALRQEPTNIEQPIRSRGRSRFSSPEYAVISEDTNRRAPSRRRPDSIPSRQAHSSSISSTTVSYAVEENVDESIPVVKPSIVTESKYETPNYPSKPLDIEIPLEGDKTSKEVSKSNENPLEDEGIPTVQIDEEKIAESRADLEPESQKPEEKLVPITRNNVRYGGNGNAKRTDDRNTGTRSEVDRGFGNFHNEIIVPRSSARTRGNISPRNGSPRTSNLLQNQIPMTKPSTGNGLSIANADISNSAEDRDIRKEIVRTSVPRIPSAAGIPTEITRSALPVKTVRKITRHRLSSNSHAEESVPTFRPRTNTRVVEDYVPVPKVIENRMDDFEDSQRTNSNQKQVEEYTQPSRSRSSPSSRELEYASPQRTRTNNAKNEEPSNSIRSNPRAAKKLTDPKPSDEVPVRTNRRGGRRRPEISTTSAPYPRRGPSVFSTSDDIASTRSRTGRKITRVEPDTNKQVDSRQTSRSRNSRPVTENIETPVERSTASSRRQGSRLRTEAPSSRHRFNGRTLSNIDETKLEVLPLFEGETKIISEPRRRTNQFASPSISDNKRVEIRESVVSEVTEVTSKRTITRKPLRRPTENKYSQTRSNTLTSSEEDISDADNYPEPYKALLQSKKFAKGSRSSNAQKVSGKIVEKIVSSTESIKTTITTPQDPLIELGEELENEVQPTTPTTSRTIKPNSKYSEYLKNRKASTPSRKFPSRSTLAPYESKPIKFNSKQNSVTKNENTSTKKPIKTFKHKEYQKNLYNKTRSSSDNGNNRGQTSQTTVPKGAKYSSRYRTNGPSRSIIRSSTAPPAYVPTIPAVISNRPTVKSQEDPELGLEFITFDAPVRSISSANLINEEYQPSSPDANLNYLESTQGKNAVTAKTSASIIERIITSIYGVNITTNSTNSDSKSLGTEEPTENSAILSLTPKYSARKSQESNNSSHLKNKSNKRDASTSEKPTTVIQRILNSLSAIQATTTETTMIVTTDGHKAAEQVGTNFNTLSYGNTTPSNLDRETASFPSTLALSSTINPLVVFDTISDEQILQKRTIGKLLNILNSLTTPHPDFTTKFSDTTKLVYVTPKSFSYVNPTSLMTSSGTMKPMIDSSTNTVTTSTSESSTESFTSMSNTLSTEIPASETVTTEISTSTIPGMSSTSDAPLSTTLPTVNNVLLSTSTRSSVPIVMNIASLLSTTTGSPSSMNSNDSNSNSSTTPSMLTTTMPSTLTTSTLDSSTQQSTMATEINANITEADGTETLITSTESTLLDISTIPIFPKFEVSPDSVTIFSANDILSNAITPDDILTTTILSPSRLADAFITTERTTFSPFDLDQFSTQGRLTSTPIDTVATTDFVTTTESMDSSTLGDTNGTTVSADVSMEAKNVTAAISNNNTAVPNSGRSGKLLQRIEDDLSNSIDSSSMGPDYFIFAVLPNNTILRKKPITYPKETPFVIVGVYPNNTVIRKFPNGTLVPMEPVIRVSGFDTRPNPPPLPDITSNQVTPDQGDRMDNPNLDTVSSMSRNASSDNVNNNNINNITPPSTSKPVSMKVSTMKTVGTTVQSIQNETTTKKTVSSNTIIPDNVTRSSTPISTTPLPSITELLNGKIVQEFNNIVNITPSSQETTTTTTTTIKVRHLAVIFLVF